MGRKQERVAGRARFRSGLKGRVVASHQRSFSLVCRRLLWVVSFSVSLHSSTLFSIPENIIAFFNFFITYFSDFSGFCTPLCSVILAPSITSNVQQQPRLSSRQPPHWRGPFVLWCNASDSGAYYHLFPAPGLPDECHGWRVFQPHVQRPWADSGSSAAGPGLADADDADRDFETSGQFYCLSSGSDVHLML